MNGSRDSKPELTGSESNAVSLNSERRMYESFLSRRRHSRHHGQRYWLDFVTQQAIPELRFEPG